MPFAANLRDYISGQYLILNRSGELVYLGKDDLYHTAPADHPAIGKYGVWHDGAGTQYFVNPDSPVTQTINLSATGDYCLSVSGTGSATVAANTATIDAGGEATDGSYVTFNVSAAGMVDVTISGDLEWCQLESGTFPSSRIYNDGTAGDGSTTSRPTQAADASGNGLSIALADLDPRVTAALGGEGAPASGGVGTMLCEIRPEFLTGVGVGWNNIVAPNNRNWFLYQNVSSVGTYDGNTAFSIPESFDPNKISKIALRWNGETGTRELLRKKEDESSWTVNSGDFDGAFDTDDYLRLFYDNEYPMWLKNLKMYDTWLTEGEIEKEFLR
jgi:hypothetical protein